MFTVSLFHLQVLNQPLSHSDFLTPSPLLFFIGFHSKELFFLFIYSFIHISNNWLILILSKELKIPSVIIYFGVYIAP